MLQTGSSSDRKGMGWVVTNFPQKSKATCDATFYHSPLTLNISRPDRESFCFSIQSIMPEVRKYPICQQPASVGQVNKVQVLTGKCRAGLGCGREDGEPRVLVHAGVSLAGCCRGCFVRISFIASMVSHTTQRNATQLTALLCHPFSCPLPVHLHPN
jgi:hypothetical protein